MHPAALALYSSCYSMYAPQCGTNMAGKSFSSSALRRDWNLLHLESGSWHTVPCTLPSELRPPVPQILQQINKVYPHEHTLYSLRRSIRISCGSILPLQTCNCVIQLQQLRTCSIGSFGCIFTQSLYVLLVASCSHLLLCHRQPLAGNDHTLDLGGTLIDLKIEQ